MITRLIAESISAFVLAGGKSSRMGRDKAFLQLKGETLLRRGLTLAGQLAPEVCIVGSREKFAAFGRVIEDEFTDCGPVGGIHAALEQTQSELNLMLAVDAPFVTAEFLHYLVGKAEESNALVTLAKTHEKWQPLCAVYRRKFVQVAGKALRERRLRLNSLVAESGPRVIDEEELQRAGFAPAMFRNLNTPDEFAAAERELG